MAEGAGLPFAELFRLNLTELHIFAEKCTTLVFPLRTAKGKRIFIAHNEDWDPKRNDIFLLRARLPGVSCVTVSYDGYLPGLSSGVNSFGLVHALNFLKPRDLKPGLPRIFVTRHVVTARSFADALGWIRRADRAFGQAIHLAQVGRYLGIELTARHAVVREPALPTVHTNHYLAEELVPEATYPSRSSWDRLSVARGLLEGLRNNGGPEFTRAEARRAGRRILSDRSGDPFAIWREGNNPADPGATVATVFLATDSDAVEIFRKRPGTSRPLALSL